ncbi:iron-containing alcohol dehydrogenase [Paenibacillus aceris]|uniref:Alcohol dehydrogenase YqhD (Iron-dependent ADH family) n=1 Tax=Paenibacillus aceris TaxID=869555 RepID=A0ABS4HZP9_9BACL|nr:iron-containing alcohol dehydrogenase [Paenibacillus aceris]MBP1963935.1 alcohol dehydrogenase YqhD (iron-dependent ADH family) [Paenibacillus aceris]NHW34646.1 iron-containing alcohol dehydrogenase [Paenibacillus aceris]
MNTFTFYNPTTLHFGQGQLEKLTAEVPKYGKNVLLVYGGGSIKQNGLYTQVVHLLKSIDASIFELGGVEPNPRLTTVHRGVDLCRTQNIDLILAVGGGSVIDCAKAIAVGAKYEGDFWDIVTRKATATGALPLGTVLTIAATGSEMNSGSVITNWETKEKLGWGSVFSYPKFSILDPAHTTSLPENQTVYGMVDIMSHVFEQYFHHGANTPIQDGFCETILRTVIDTAPRLLQDLNDLENRATILYSGTMALNGILSMGVRGDWATHNLEHAVSAVHDIPHGGGLAILFPNWMTYTLDANEARFKQFAQRVFGVTTTGKSDRQVAEEGIAELRGFFNSIGAPSRLADYDIDDSTIELMADKAMVYGDFGHFKKLTREDVVNIYRMSL